MATTPPVKAQAGRSNSKARKAHPAAKAGGATKPAVESAVESVAGIELESALQVPPSPPLEEADLRMSLAEPSGVLAPLPVTPSDLKHAPESIEARFETMLETVHRNRPHDDLDLIRRAWEFCVQQHAGQKRASGEPYIIHPLEVCQILADLKMDSTAIAAGLLHDAVEDTDVTSPEIAKRFNEQVAHIVEGVTKLDKIKFANREDHQAENIRKMLLAMVTDVRVVIIKLADRLHNMRTLQHLKPEKQQKIARETLDIYAPLAHRLGMGKLRGELEDLAFQYTDSFAYTQLSSEVEALRGANENFLANIVAAVQGKLAEAGIEVR
jgi:guanosine-3',5'-bis(diphosphate) 3'-pyrophosphohydrolase